MLLSAQGLNIAAYYFSVLVAYTFGAQRTQWSDILKLKTAKEISNKYPSLVTPVAYAFEIWGLIAVLEAISVCWQYTLLADGTNVEGHGQIPFIFNSGSTHWVLTCILQCLWTFAFGWDMIYISSGIIFLALYNCYQTYNENMLSLLSLSPEDKVNETYAYFWAVLPFAIHSSWLMVVALIQINICAVSRKTSSTGQISLALLTLAAILISGGIVAGSLLGTIGYARSMNAIGSTYIGSRVAFLGVVVWAAWCIQEFDAELSGVTTSSKKSDEMRTETVELIPLSRMQGILLQRFKGVVFRSLIGGIVGVTVLYVVKWYKLQA